MNDRLLGLRALRMPKTADVVAARVRTTVLARQLPAGTKLPGERELAEQLGVSRDSVRAALRILESEGVIEIRRGVLGGVFSAEPSEERLSAALSALLAHRQSPMVDLKEMRLLLEPEASARAARRATAEERRYLQELARDAHTDGVGELAEFHTVLGRMSGNAFMALFIASMRDVEADPPQVASLSPKALESTKRAHIAIADAVAAGDATAARRATERHVRAYFDTVFADALEEPIIALSEIGHGLLDF